MDTDPPIQLPTGMGDSWDGLNFNVESLDSIKELFPDESISFASLLHIYASAQYNHINQLLVTMNAIRDSKCRDYLLNMRYIDHEGQSMTPLTIAAGFGHVMYVKTLLSQYNIDLERESDVLFDDLLVRGATALWVAAASDNMQIVKLLIEHGAQVDHTTGALSSPLRAASYSGALNIVKYLIEQGADVNLSNRYQNTCLMIAAFKGHKAVVETLLDNGANPNKQALCGATALHYCAGQGHVDICSLLLKHKAALLLNENNLTPVLCAAERTQENVVEYFMSQPDLMTREDKINALELLGASFANSEDNYDISKAYEYLLNGMELRYTNGELVIPKNVLPPVMAYGDWLETENINDLRAIRLNHHSIHMEGLTIRERILGKNYPDLQASIIYRGAMLSRNGNFIQCVRLWSYAMQLAIDAKIPIDRHITRLVGLFIQINNVQPEILEINIILPVFVKCAEEIERNIKRMKEGDSICSQSAQAEYQKNLLAIIDLLRMITKDNNVLSYISKDHMERLYVTIKKLFKNDVRLSNGQTLLHMAVNTKICVDILQSDTQLQTAMVALLVYLGADVNAVDNDHDTPLHTLLSRCNNHPQPNAQEIVQILLNGGAHLDAVNCKEQTPYEIGLSGPLRQYLIDRHNSRISLKCIAARCVAQHKIDYVNIVPKTLEPFVRLHSPQN